MEDLEKTKENIQPLRGGRNMEQLEIALTSESQLVEERRAHEQRIESYEGNDPLQPWYDYICWIEQTTLNNGKSAASNEILLRCIAKFENDERYHQDHRFIKLCMKYIDTQRSPQELYQELYDRGIGTLCAEMYIGWAYYYDAEDNFALTEAIFRKALDAGASPKEDIEQAHRQFGFSMSQRLLHKDESSKMQFKNTLVERRNALTSLKAHQKKHVGSLRTGLAIKSFNPGIVNQENIPNSMNFNNLAVYTGTSEHGIGNQPIVRSLINASRDRENIREPGPWSNAKGQHKRVPLFGSSHGPSFKISEDTSQDQPIPLLVENLSRGILLPQKHKRENYPQTIFELAVCDDDKPSGFPMYDKLSLYCRGSKEDFCPEELHGYRYFKRRGIVNKITERYDSIWANGAEAGIRLHPYHVREFKFKPGSDIPTEKLVIDDSIIRTIQTKVKQMYADEEEKSLEEIQLHKWKEGKIKRYIDHKHDDDMLRIDMDETIVQTKRVSIAPPRFSMAPLPAGPSRKSVLPSKSNMNKISEEDTDFSMVDLKNAPVNDGKDEAKCTGAIKKSDIYKRRSYDSPDLKDKPQKKLSIQELQPDIAKSESVEGEESDLAVSIAKPKSKLTIPIYLDVDEPNDNKNANNFYPNDTCSTQMFNMFVKSQSTPVAMKSSATIPKSGTQKTKLYMDEQEVQDENLAQMHPVKINDENAEPELMIPSTSNITHAPKQLSTIMERTENSTISGASSTKSSVSSPPQVDIISPQSAISDDDRHVLIKNMKHAVKNLSSMQIDTASKSKAETNGIFKIPESLANPTTSKPAEHVEQDKSTKSAIVSPFVIHIDSTETMANVPLVSKVDLLQKNLDDKENKLSLESSSNPSNLFQVPEEATATGTASLFRKNISHLPQREPGVNSIMGFKVTAERTNTVPLPLVKQSDAPSIHAAATTKANDSLFELLVKTPSPKASKAKTTTSPLQNVEQKPSQRVNSSFFDLADFQKTPEPKVQTAKHPISKQSNSSTLELPTSQPHKPIIIQSVMGAINLADFPSPPKRQSTEDLNTEIFSINMNNIKNSTLLPDQFSEYMPLHKFGSEISPGGKKSPKIDFNISNNDMMMQFENLEKKQIDSDGFTVPAPVFKSPPIIDLDDGDSDDLGRSIYVQKQASPVDEVQRWDEIDEHFNPANNQYMKKEVDLDGTVQFIYQQTHLGEVDPFDPKLQEAFLEQLDFMSYLEDLATCSLVNKVQPLSKGMTVDICGTMFTIQKKIGEGTYGTVYSAKNHSSNKSVAMKQERPANLWEYYVCLELRSRIVNEDILPGLMSIDYAVVGNNASILVSSLSRYGNILDVCNKVKRVTNRNVDEFIAMIITSQILSIIDHLHSCMIIHADIKPDNFLLMAPVDLDARIPCVQLIDFGVSIDLKLFPKETTFTKVVTTECFTCIEMLEKRPWTYQPDLYGVAGTAHVMLFGTYMEVQKDIVNWNIKARMPRYFRKTVWDNFFSTMLNIRDCNEMPNLQTLRSSLLVEIEENKKYVRDKVFDFNHAMMSS